ncbi:carboxypeptidase regulatory-like domain-containing protein [Actinoplanes sp. NPDC051343]|uniref:carboxypeptidase regulatory-like domain-containing protein n=1 Tax=Actinoplanes sp. NPDC051343 TaxID=3363906 RepID=UPI0037A05560
MIYRSKGTRRGRAGAAVAAAAALVAGVLAGATPAQAAPTRYTPAPCNSLTARQVAADVPYARCFAVSPTDPSTGKKAAARAAAAGPPDYALTPSDIQNAYRLPDAGAGMTVAIVDAFGYDNAESDLAVFRSFYGLSACTSADGCFTKIDERGGTDYPDQDGGWSIETALDLDAVSSACPQCKILLVQADSNDAVDLAQAVGTAAGRKPAAISNSYGVDGEFPGEQTLDTYYDHPGIAVTVSTGDTGNVQSYPATSPVVTAVGGTELIKDDSARGWNEVAWDSGGSGCSVYEPAPDFQRSLKSGCDSRVTADISADAATPLGVYNTLGQTGWAPWGGTSLASPLTAAMYALAGAPTPGTYPSTYPYLNAGSLYDVTQGANSDCGNVLCQAGPGWDGPTGLGTPVGLSALTLGDSGAVDGKVTSGGSGLGGAAVVATGAKGDRFTATTGSDGTYDLRAPVGSYDLTVSKFGYRTGQATGVTIAKGTPATQNFDLQALPTRTISGHVTDGSGHGWPMRSKITVDGYPGGAIYSDAFTGHYSVSLPIDQTYELHVASADLPGYVGQDLSVPLSADTRRDIALAADTTACDAPGYAFQEEGRTQAFTGWTGATPKDGWTVTDAAGNGQTWRFEDMGGYGPPPGGDADFADVDSDKYGEGGKQDTSLVSPVVDLSGRTDPEIGFDSTYIGFPDQTGYVDLSLDGGTTWSTVRSLDGGVVQHLDIKIPQAAGHDQARVRFRFVGDWGRRWEIDNVVVGARYCGAQPGGLVAGHVTDANTGGNLSGATVAADDDPATLGATDADGYYWLYSSHLGKTAFTVTDGRYAAGHPTVNVPADSVREADVALDAGHVTVSPSALTAKMTLGASTSQTVTFGNDGKVPLHVHLGESDAGATPAVGKGAPAMRVKSSTSIASMPSGKAASPEMTAQPSISPWTDIAGYALPVMDNTTAAHNGTVYVAGGNDGVNKLQVAGYYDAAAGGWHRLPDLPEALSAAAGAFIDDTFYVVGGWNEQGDTSVRAYALKDGATAWRKVADLPSGVAAAGTAVVAGKLYVVGGCTTGACLPVSAGAYSYDPGADKWTREPDYPAAVGYLACGSAASAVICAGGNSGGGSLTRTYAYVPGSGSWKARADLPADTWGAAAASANGRFEVIGGAVGGGSAITNQGWEYDPATDSWAALPNANNATYRGGAACGIFQVGGSTGGFNPTSAAALLPGYGDCGGDVPWLSESATDLTVAPGGTVKVRVGIDSSQVSQPGVYAGLVTVSTDTPYPTAAPVSVSMTATPPAAWGKIEGTVASAGKPLAGATVAVCTMYDTRTGACGPTTFTLKTDADGHYQLWLNKGYNPLEVIAAKDGYTPLVKIVKIQKGETVTTDFALAGNASFSTAKVNQYLAGALKKR